tara:strand:- start:1276 stop:2961 length:1686 start_codon:yes stop_codon:yes gene_type:complete
MTEESKNEFAKKAARLMSHINHAEEHYRKNVAVEDARNLAYWRGQFWEGDGTSPFPELSNYNAEQNEVFPIIDTIISALALDLPQCEVLDARQRSYEIPQRSEDITFSGRRIAAVLNWMAEKDDMDEMSREAVLHAMLFSSGAIRKITWSKELGRVIWRLKMPWEVQFDSVARRISDIAWASERFILHESQVRARIEDGSYTLSGNRVIKPDTYPRSLIEDYQTSDQEQEIRRKGLKEYITMHEYWDFREKKLYHIHMGTKQIVMETDAPYGNPYDQLCFHPGVGRIRGIPDATLIAPLQQDINELVSARREIVRRLPRRMFYDKAMFPSEEDAARFMKAATWEPVPVETDGQSLVGDMIFVTPEMPTTFDFNNHLGQASSHIKNIAGMADFQRGEVKNIRTAAEANMIQMSIQGRMQVRTRLLVKFIQRGFDKAAEITRWCLTNPEASGIDMEMLAMQTQLDATPDLLRSDFLENMPKFRVLPFSPLMEDRVVRRQQLVELLGSLAQTPSGDEVDWREITKELVEMFNIRPSIMKEEGEQEEPTPEQMPPMAGGIPFPGA